MNIRVMFTLTLGLCTVFANPVTKPEIDESLSLANVELEIKPDDKNKEEDQYDLSLTSNSDLEVPVVTEINDELPKLDEPDVDIIIEEAVEEPNDVPQMESDSAVDYYPEIDDPYAVAPNDKVEDEIMDTAAGIVPFTIFRRRQKPRRRYITRRRFTPRWNPYRSFQFFYPYYGFYRPSSLRYY